jgi:hypothetical protein
VGGEVNATDWTHPAAAMEFTNAYVVLFKVIELPSKKTRSEPTFPVKIPPPGRDGSAFGPNRPGGIYTELRDMALE